jgi:hypothetical protein
MAVEGRDWSTYNDSLVRRGYIGIHPSMLDEWRRELKRENRGKVGLPYRYPESFVRLIAYMRTIFHLPYRQAEGLLRPVPLGAHRWPLRPRLLYDC